ncbi:hypothetical protein, partial [Klebsiella pneumoniae]|uniref:hypothetical protein n=1 Tax=Klebsiella pneumoniae TaxID=573 RepID=UPI00132F81DB
AFPLEVAIPGTPQVFRGKTPQDVLNQLVTAQTNATQAIHQARQEAQQARAEAEALRGQIPPPPPPDASDAEKQAYY